MPRRRLALLGGLLVLASVAFMTLDAKGSWSFLLPFRGLRLINLALVGASIAAATVLFQTVTANRILTPAIMGFDSLYILIQSLLIFSFGGMGYAMIDSRVAFLGETFLMMAAAATLFALLVSRGRQDLHRMLLVGIIFGTLFRSLAVFLQRLMDPNAFAVLQGASFASFGNVEADLLGVAAFISCCAMIPVWRSRHDLDVLALGRETAISLGVAHANLTRNTLLLVSVLVSVSTALVGPVAFLGLLVASLAHVIVHVPRHALLLPAAAMIGATTLVLGQTLFERILGLQSALGVVIEFIGGILFLVLLLRGRTI